MNRHLQRIMARDATAMDRTYVPPGTHIGITWEDPSKPRVTAWHDVICRRCDTFVPLDTDQPPATPGTCPHCAGFLPRTDTEWIFASPAPPQAHLEQLASTWTTPRPGEITALRAGHRAFRIAQTVSVLLAFAPPVILAVYLIIGRQFSVFDAIVFGVLGGAFIAAFVHSFLLDRLARSLQCTAAGAGIPNVALRLPFTGVAGPVNSDAVQACEQAYRTQHAIDAERNIRAL